MMATKLASQTRFTSTFPVTNAPVPLIRNWFRPQVSYDSVERQNVTVEFSTRALSGFGGSGGGKRSWRSRCTRHFPRNCC